MNRLRAASLITAIKTPYTVEGNIDLITSGTDGILFNLNSYDVEGIAIKASMSFILFFNC